MPELGDDELFHREAHGRLRAWQRDDDASGDEAGDRPAHHRRRSNLLVAQKPEQLAETIEGAELFLYPGDRHLFTDDSLPDYDEKAARLLTERVLSFLDTT